MMDDAPPPASDRKAIDRVAAVVGSLDGDLADRLRFLLELDRLKGILRRSLVLAGERRENSAEHSWHLAMFALVLAPHADEAIDLARVKQAKTGEIRQLQWTRIGLGPNRRDVPEGIGPDIAKFIGVSCGANAE